MKIRTLFIATLSLLAVACNYNAESGSNSDSTFRIMTYNVGAINKFIEEDFSI